MVVLVHAFPPDAEVPVVQLSINALKPFAFHVDLGARLAPLRARGILVVGSGNVVHNLGRIDWSRPSSGFDWTRRFDDAAREMASSPEEVERLQGHEAFGRAVSTPDHFIPLLYLAGLASAGGAGAEVLVDGYAMGSLSMTSYTLGTHCDLRPGEMAGSPGVAAPPRRRDQHLSWRPPRAQAPNHSRQASRPRSSMSWRRRRSQRSRVSFNPISRAGRPSRSWSRSPLST